MFETSLSALFRRSNALILGMEIVLPDLPIDLESRNLRIMRNKCLRSVFDEQNKGLDSEQAKQKPELALPNQCLNICPVYLFPPTASLCCLLSELSPQLHHVRRPRSRGKPRGPGSTAWWEAAARVAGLVSWQPRNAPPRVKQVAAASLLPLAPGSSACSSAVRLPVEVAESMDAGSGPPGSHLRLLYSRDLKKVQEKGDSDITTGEKRYSTKRKDLLESKGCFASVISPGRRVSPSSTETGLSVGGPLSPGRGFVHLDPAAELDLKSSSSHSDHSSETSLPEVQKDKYPQEFSLLKLQTKDGQRPEWTFYPRFSSNIHTYHVGKQCFFNGVFLGNRRSLSERIVDKSLGRKKCVLDPRNGIPKLTPGDNPYMYPEQSKGFHKAGSTLPPVNFSIVPYEKKFDTFIPLEPLPQIPNLPFWVKEKANMLKSEIREVEELDDWQPAVSLLHSLLPAGSLDFPRQS
ncbi:spermatogenesis-associated serine-rich protein 1 [Bos mutus]|uniref:spermatogenesis-associated serine-rich protein 1 n=1 Tax=Bos mutus TaxID=72004 RepID=UPI0006D91099|nr:PREDICTED: spermatogenesis-associated serine-rich protein 1 [Bos mutus]